MPQVLISDINVDTIGYPIIVPITLTSVPSNLMYLYITKQGDDSNVININPTRILLDITTLNTYFELTIIS